MEHQNELTRLKRIDWVEIRLPGWQNLGRYLLWSAGRVSFSAWFFGLYTIKVSAKILINLCEMVEGSTKQLLTIYCQLPHMGLPSQSVVSAIALPISNEIQDVITDLVGQIEQEDKPVMILGGTGSGKSTVAQYLAYAYGGKVKIYEPEGTPDDWQGLEVVGKGENWDAINAGMAEDLEDLSAQIQLRTEKGNAALSGSEKVLIVEEYPEVRQKCENADEWIERHARRGRKGKRFVIALSQYDKVSAWGFEGKSDLADGFVKIRLGKKAVIHAKSLKNEDLMTWLQLDRSHCLYDDQPCKLPSYREMKAVTQRLSFTPQISPVVMAKTTGQQALQPPITENNQISETAKKAIKALLQAGWSDSKIIKEILGCQGAQYQRGKELLDNFKKE